MMHETPSSCSASGRLVERLAQMYVDRGSILRVLIVASMVGMTLLTLVSRDDGPGAGQAEAAPLANHNGNGGNGNGDGGNGNGGNGNGGNGNGGNGNGGGDAGQPATAAQAPAPPPPPTCAFAGRETLLTSPDGRITIRVFSTMTRNIRVAARMPVDPATVPSPPPPVGGLLFELQAEICEGGALGELPAEVNLGIRYSDQEAAGMGEQGFTISMLDPADRQWRPVEKQAADPPNNWVSATITRMGFYVVHAR